MQRALDAVRALGPVVIVVGGFLLIAYFAAQASLIIGQRLADPRPRDPFEAELVADGWRASHGLPVYEPPQSGHATLMYGFAEPYVLGWLYAVFPATKLIPLLLSLVSALALVALGVAVVRPFADGRYAALLALALFSIDDKVAYFAVARPDLPAWALGLAGLACLYAATPGKLGRRYLAGVVLITAGVAFKQPVAMLVLVPPIATILEWRRLPSPPAALALACGPAAAVGLLFAVIWACFPQVFFYMVTVPRSFPVIRGWFLRDMLGFALSSACLVCGLVVAALLGTLAEAERGRRTLWLSVTLAVAVPLCALTYAKVGGAPNSFIPAWFALITLAVLLAARCAPSCPGQPTLPADLGFLAVSAGLALTLASTAVPMSDRWLVHDRFGDGGAKYRQAIGYVAGLRGVVLSPDDPTILIEAGRAPSGSVFADEDALGWPRPAPPALVGYLSHADYLVHDAGWWRHWLDRPVIAAMGYSPQWSNGEYSVWKKAPGVSAPQAPTIAGDDRP